MKWAGDRGKCRVQWEPISRGHGKLLKTSTETWRAKSLLFCFVFLRAWKEMTRARKCTDLGSTPSGPGMCFFQQYLTTDLGHPCLCLQPPSKLLSSHNLWNQPPAILSLQDQLTQVFVFNSSLLINHELPDSSECSTTGGPVHCSINLHLRASHTYLSLGFISTGQCGSEGVGLFFMNWPRRSHRSHAASL